MELFHKHRIMEVIEKKRKQGQNLTFLTGPAINERDHYFCGQLYGAQSLGDSLRLFYGMEPLIHDWFIHIHDSMDNIVVERFENGKFIPSNLGEFCLPPARKGVLKRKEPDANAKSSEAGGIVDEAVENQHPRLNQINAALKSKSSRIFILIENLDLAASLYKAEPDLFLLSCLRDWQTLPNAVIVVTISDMELLEKYSFPDDCCYVGYPDAREIYGALWRHLIRKYPQMDIHVPDLEAICYALASGKKTLNNCMRILRKFDSKPASRLCLQDFEENFEKGIEEKVKWEDVCLDDKIKHDIENAIDTFISAANSRFANDLARKGLIFTGPPGTGKTMIAKALANEKHCHFMAPKLSDLKGEYVGQSSARVKNVFAEARASQPTIIFIDEADTVFPVRDGGGGDSFGLDMVNQFLQEIDGADTGTQKIFIIAATNRPYAVDPAILSRLDKPVEIPLPGKEMRLKLFDLNFRKVQPNHPFTLQGSSFEEYVSLLSDGMSGRDIANFVKQLKENHPADFKNDKDTEDAFKAGFARAKRDVLRKIKSVFSSGNVIEPEENKLSFNSVRGLENQKIRLHYQAEVISDPAVSAEYVFFQLEPARGVLLYGPPGNGKTRLAHALAGEYGFYFFKVLSRDFSGNSPKMILDRLDEIFTLVLRFSRLLNEREGVILFFDEIDSLASRRVLDPVVRGTLLNYLGDEEGLRKNNSRVLFIGATNYMEDIDEALIRSGRIDSLLLVDNPQRDDAVSVLEMMAYDDPKTNFSKNILKTAYSYLADLKTFGAISRERQNLNKQQNDAGKYNRPSYADLGELYRGLKEMARHMRKIADGKLQVDEDVLAKYFNMDVNSNYKN